MTDTSSTRRLKSPGIGIVEIEQAIQAFDSELQDLYQSLAESGRYSTTMFSESSESVRVLLVHLSWHQAYCDLYRIYLPGYREAAPSSILQNMSKEELHERQALCLQHATAIVNLLMEFSGKYTSQVMDFDAAICAYHSARLILFIAGTDPSAHSLVKTDALEMARFCRTTLETFFGNTPMAMPMVST